MRGASRQLRSLPAAGLLTIVLALVLCGSASAANRPVMNNADMGSGSLRDTIATANPGDTVVITFSSHGGQVRDDNGDEADGLDEYLVPHDFVPVPAMEVLLKRMRRHAFGLCPVCGYDLRASSERCPECGTPIRGTAPAAQRI